MNIKKQGYQDGVKAALFGARSGARSGFRGLSNPLHTSPIKQPIQRPITPGRRIGTSYPPFSDGHPEFRRDVGEFKLQNNWPGTGPLKMPKKQPPSMLRMIDAGVENDFLKYDPASRSFPSK